MHNANHNSGEMITLAETFCSSATDVKAVVSLNRKNIIGWETNFDCSLLVNYLGFGAVTFS
jgi:hypothetical protein